MDDQDGVVTGIGGIFVKSENTEKLVAWYQEKLGFPYDGYSSSFLMSEADDPSKVGNNIWAPFKHETDYFKPSKKDFMINLRVRGLEALLKRLKDKGVEQIGKTEEYDYGRFAWIIDPEGTKIELWEQIGDPPAVDAAESS
jgi:predicted enzyme related to lactoylglutathione lyase